MHVHLHSHTYIRTYTHTNSKSKSKLQWSQGYHLGNKTARDLPSHLRGERQLVLTRQCALTAWRALISVTAGNSAASAAAAGAAAAAAAAETVAAAVVAQIASPLSTAVVSALEALPSADVPAGTGIIASASKAPAWQSSAQLSAPGRVDASASGHHHTSSEGFPESPFGAGPEGMPCFESVWRVLAELRATPLSFARK